MKLFVWIIMGCYMTLFILLGASLVSFSLHWVPVEGALQWLEMAYLEKNLRIACFVTGVGLILLNWIIVQLTLAKLQRQKIIAFDNPDGQVTVSLSAVEDFVRRAAKEVPSVRDLRADVVAGKGKIVVRAKVSLWAEAHIPEVTEQLQSVVKARVSEMLAGIEEPIYVRIHVAKISHREEGPRPSRREEQLSTPFRGGF
ncbi:MAG: alkaline shock response membrane anchor protein AmaP [Candidatus Omnitrophica bacterium]|nr:alkaline shock response membrane anchor protein AmaP [Candidatus Omnitrophota bacterium]